MRLKRRLRVCAFAGLRVQRANALTRQRANGFTLIEIMLGTSIMVIVLAAMLGSFFGQSYLNTNSRNMIAAMNDATRIMEQIRQQNSGAVEPCASQAIPNIVPPSPYTSWDMWLGAQTSGRSIQGGLERVVVTCQNETGVSYCDSTQVGTGEWRVGATNTPSLNPLRVTIAICWSQRGRAIGECTVGPQSAAGAAGLVTPFFGATFNGSWSIAGAGAADLNADGRVDITDIGVAIQRAGSTSELKPSDGANNGPVNQVIDSEAMLTTVVTCR